MKKNLIKFAIVVQENFDFLTGGQTGVFNSSELAVLSAIKNGLTEKEVIYKLKEEMLKRAGQGIYDVDREKAARIINEKLGYLEDNFWKLEIGVDSSFDFIQHLLNITCSAEAYQLRKPPVSKQFQE